MEPLGHFSARYLAPQKCDFRLAKVKHRTCIRANIIKFPCQRRTSELSSLTVYRCVCVCTLASSAKYMYLWKCVCLWANSVQRKLSTIVAKVSLCVCVCVSATAVFALALFTVDKQNKQRLRLRLSSAQKEMGTASSASSVFAAISPLENTQTWQHCTLTRLRAHKYDGKHSFSLMGWIEDSDVMEETCLETIVLFVVLRLGEFVSNPNFG